MRYSSFFLGLCVLFVCSTSGWAQRTIGGENLQLDNGAGTLVTIQLPAGLGAGPYTWTLPITSSGGGTAIVNSGTTLNSTLTWNGTNWAENPNVLSIPSDGFNCGIGATDPTLGFGVFGANSGSGNGGSVTLHAGQASGAGFQGGTATVQGGYGGASGGTGGDAYVHGGNAFASNFAGGQVTIEGGTSLGNATGAQVTIEASNGGSSGAGGGTFIFGGSADNGISSGSAASGGDVQIDAGTGGGSNAGGNVILQAGQGGATGVGGAAQIYGGSGGSTSGAGGPIQFYTTPDHSLWTQRMQITPTGVVQVSGFAGGFHSDGTGSVSVQDNDLVVIETSSTGTGITLPASPTAGRVLMLRNNSSSTISVNGNGHNVNGSNPYNLVTSASANFTFPSGITIVYDGSNWWAVGEAP